jgi:hypothetical protein
MTKGSLLPFVAVVLLAACHGSDQAPGSKPAPAARAPTTAQGPTPEQLTVGMVEAVTIGKSTLPVAVKFDLPRRPQVGQPLDVVIAVMPQDAAGSARVEAAGVDGLQLGASAGPFDIPSPQAGQVYRLTVPVIPSAEGVQFLALVVSLKRDDVIESRSFSVPLIVGAAAAPGAAGAVPAGPRTAPAPAAAGAVPAGPRTAPAPAAAGAAPAGPRTAPGTAGAVPAAN